MKKIILLGKDLAELINICTDNELPKFHGQQLYKWMYQKTILDVDKMSNIPSKLKNIISEEYQINLLNTDKKITSNSEDTIKYLFKTNDSKLIESVSMIDKKRHTICISSQIGCSVDCDFCATGKMGIIRNLNCGEIIQQLIIIKQNRNIPITNIVFMGMGEPFLNYSNVIKSCKILNDPNGFNLSSKRITISTSGILPKIKQFIDEKHKYKLAISLNASNNKTRDKLIPINKKWPIESILNSIDKYSYKKYRPIMFEYILIDNINDSIENAIELSNLLKNINCKINIIPYNETDNDYKRSNKIEAFVKQLNNNNYNYRVLVRWSKGQGIDAACGQLATKNE
tara:strand:+ start:24418 stop:25443 length:1026 start_codon:yes stop_codon:yes gene_type:complete